MPALDGPFDESQDRHSFDRPIHSTERLHDLSASCWCQPTIERIPGAGRTVQHHP